MLGFQLVLAVGCYGGKDQPGVNKVEQQTWSPPSCPWGSAPTTQQWNEMCYKSTEFAADNPFKRGQELLCGWAPCAGQGAPWNITAPKSKYYNCFSWADDFRTDIKLDGFDSLRGSASNGTEELGDVDWYYQTRGWSIADSYYKECNYRVWI